MMIYRVVTDRSGVLLFCPNRTEQVNYSSCEGKELLSPPIQPLCTGHLDYFLTYQVSLAQDGVTEQEEHDYSTHRINHIILLWIACYDFPSILCSYFLSSQLQEKNIPYYKYYYHTIAFCSENTYHNKKPSGSRFREANHN